MKTNIQLARDQIGAAKYLDEALAVHALLAQTPYDHDLGQIISCNAAALVNAARNASEDRSILDTFMIEYGLSNAEGIALMCLAESLLRVPDSATANQLIADKVSFANWAEHLGTASSQIVNASTWALMLTGKLISVDREFASNPGQWLRQLTNRVSAPVVQAAMRAAMQILGQEFVLGETIQAALTRSDKDAAYSYDMLGEGARTSADARNYYDAYTHAISAIGNGERSPNSPRLSISIKLSALHPRYEAAQRGRVVSELYDTVRALCLQSAAAEIDLAIDAEEANRLELSLDIFEALARDESIAHWQGLGFVVQAYGKRAPRVLQWLVELARETGRRIPVRLVKGAYWDAEIKHSQVMGYPGFPVFTRKPTTDLSYLVCAGIILSNPTDLFGQFATHNAHTVVAVITMAGAGAEFEFQKLHGMGDAMYGAAKRLYTPFPTIRTYAPVGGYDDLLAYLVRRLLENGANSSFVNRFLDEKLPAENIVKDPIGIVGAYKTVSHARVLHPAELFQPDRQNSAGLDLSDQNEVDCLQEACKQRPHKLTASSLVSGRPKGEQLVNICNPADRRDMVGRSLLQNRDEIDEAFEVASNYQPAWDQLGGIKRADVLETAATLLEKRRVEFISLLCREAGKTLPDAVAEVREAVDFCRYYASQARRQFAAPEQLPGPTGELNEFSLHGRGVFVCISPWNFPLAIFLGQVSAALLAGNTVVAKPSEETPIVAFEAVKLLHEASVPVEACQLILGDGTIGASLVAHPLVAGVAFTGSTATARRINRTLADRDGSIVPLIAETGGQNAMIVDSTALLEQVTDDIVQSAFLSAGQRCSALRVLFIQEDIADKAVKMTMGAMDELYVGNPAYLRTDIGPVISAAAATDLENHIARMRHKGQLIHRTQLTDECQFGHYVAPAIVRIENLAEITAENFGPILHVIHFEHGEIEDVLHQIHASGYGLTLGVHSRIETNTKKIAEAARVGNVYINRNMTGAVVGSQPFGGQGLSGTGPKAGGPNYLPRFAFERVVSINTVATGGNTELLLLDDSDSA